MPFMRPLPANEHYPVPGHSHAHQPGRPGMARHAGRDDTMNPDPSRVGTEFGYQGRDVLASEVPYNAEPGLFRRLHAGS